MQSLSGDLSIGRRVAADNELLYESPLFRTALEGKLAPKSVTMVTGGTLVWRCALPSDLIPLLTRCPECYTSADNHSLRSHYDYKRASRSNNPRGD